MILGFCDIRGGFLALTITHNPSNNIEIQPPKTF